LVAERDEQKKRIAELEATNKKLVDQLWGRRTERRLDGTATPLLDFGDDFKSLLKASTEVLDPNVIAAQAAAQAALDAAKLAELEARRKAKRAKQENQKSREVFPSHLERRDIVLDLSEEEKVGLKQIGTKIFERMRFEKPSVYIERILRHLYVKEDAAEPTSSPVVAAPTLPAIVEGCKYDFSVIAAIVGTKFAFYLPTYREQDFFGQFGWSPSRSTCNDLINYAVGCIEPLFRQMNQRLMDQSILFGDATEITVLLREPLSDDAAQSLVQRKKNRHKELEAKLKAHRSKPSSSKAG
jgi:transposase